MIPERIILMSDSSGLRRPFLCVSIQFSFPPFKQTVVFNINRCLAQHSPLTHQHQNNKTKTQQNDCRDSTHKYQVKESANVLPFVAQGGRPPKFTTGCKMNLFLTARNCSTQSFVLINNPADPNRYTVLILCSWTVKSF